eukprot:scaffold2823_cov91-Skeletonema_marinoi.AAC.1
MAQPRKRLCNEESAAATFSLEDPNRLSYMSLVAISHASINSREVRLTTRQPSHRSAWIAPSATTFNHHIVSNASNSNENFLGAR